MSVQDATGFITTGSGNLDLFSPDTLPADQTVPRFDFVEGGLQIGAAVKRRQIAESMYMDDALQVQSSRGRSTSQLAMFVTGHDHASLATNTAALLAAIDQSEWELHVLMGGSAEYAWSFWDAEPTVAFPVAAWYGLYQQVLVTSLRSPIPVAGPV